MWVSSVIIKYNNSLHIFCRIKSLMLFSLFLVRATLGVLVITTLKLYRHALQNIFGVQFTKWFVAVTVTQYHFMYYLSRPLPNIMVMPLGNKVKFFICICHLQMFNSCNFPFFFTFIFFLVN